MNESTKRVIDWLTLPFLCLPATVIGFSYINNTHPSKILIALLMFDTPFAAAAFIWLGWRFLPWGERTKRIVDWLTLIPLGLWPTMVVWAHYTRNDGPPSLIFLTLLLINFLLSLTSFFWLLSRIDEIKMLHWFTYNIAMSRMLLFTLCCLAIVLHLIKLINWLWK
jgi:hypothetical protein